MNADEIRSAVEQGKIVCWGGLDYVVKRREEGGSFFICSLATNHCISLTWADGQTLNGRPDEFYVAD